MWFRQLLLRCISYKYVIMNICFVVTRPSCISNGISYVNFEDVIKNHKIENNNHLSYIMIPEWIQLWFYIDMETFRDPPRSASLLSILEMMLTITFWKARQTQIDDNNSSTKKKTTPKKSNAISNCVCNLNLI